MPIISLNQKPGCCQRNQPTSLSLPIASHAKYRIRFHAARKPSTVLLPMEALELIRDLTEKGSIIDAVDLYGPGDVLSSPEKTLETIDLIKKHFPELKITLTTIGLRAEQLASTFAKKGLDGINILVNTMNVQTACRIYTWIRPGKKTIPLEDAAEFLITEQQRSITACSRAGLQTSITTSIYPGINDKEIETISSKLSQYGASSMIIRPYRPEKNSDEELPSCDFELLETTKNLAAAYLNVTVADDEKITARPDAQIPGSSGALPKPTSCRPNVAVVSSNGMDIDLHLGEAIKILIYGPRNDGLACLLENRPAPEPGTGNSRWKGLAEQCLHDCFAILAADAGNKPREILSQHGIKLLTIEDNIEGTVDVLYGGGKKKKK